MEVSTLFLVAQNHLVNGLVADRWELGVRKFVRDLLGTPLLRDELPNNESPGLRGHPCLTAGSGTGALDRLLVSFCVGISSVGCGVALELTVNGRTVTPESEGDFD